MGHDARKLEPEALEEWRAHPVTQWLLAVLRKGASQNRKALEAQLWQDGQCNPEHLGRCKAQEELIDDIADGDVDDWNEWSRHFEQQRDTPG